MSKYHCEFFREGAAGSFYHGTAWSSMKELLVDMNRPKGTVGEVTEPFKCAMLERASLPGRRRRRTAPPGAATS